MQSSCYSLWWVWQKTDRNPEDAHQHIAQFTQHCIETGVIEDFSFVISKNPAPCNVNLEDSIDKATMGNLLLDASQATIETFKLFVIKSDPVFRNFSHCWIQSKCLLPPNSWFLFKIGNGFMFYLWLFGPQPCKQSCYIIKSFMTMTALSYGATSCSTSLELP